MSAPFMLHVINFKEQLNSLDPNCSLLSELPALADHVLLKVVSTL